MQIILTAVEEPLANAWEEYCGDLPDVTIHRGSILDVPCDAIASPANYADAEHKTLHTERRKPTKKDRLW